MYSFVSVVTQTQLNQTGNNNVVNDVRLCGKTVYADSYGTGDFVIQARHLMGEEENLSRSFGGLLNLLSTQGYKA